MFCSDVLRNEMKFNAKFNESVKQYISENGCTEEEALQSPAIQSMYRSCSEV